MWGQKTDGTNVFEERVVAFKALSDQEAFEKAKIEAKEYSKEREDGEYECYPEQVLYLLDEEELIDGYEVWSEMFEAKLSLNEFYDNRYSQYEYHPE
jgi:hypothetical protein